LSYEKVVTNEFKREPIEDMWKRREKKLKNFRVMGRKKNCESHSSFRFFFSAINKLNKFGILQRYSNPYTKSSKPVSHVENHDHIKYFASQHLSSSKPNNTH